jgi:uncharacterized protein
MNEYLYRTTPTRLGMVTEGPTEREREIVGQHFAYLSDLTDKGVMVLVGRTQNNDERTFGIAIFRAESDDAAQRIMENDPAVKNGVMHGELFPYRIALKSWE